MKQLLFNESGGRVDVEVTHVGNFTATANRNHNLATEFPETYQQLELWKNIFVCGTNFQYSVGADMGDGYNLRPSYDATTGVLTVRGVRYSNYSIAYRVYVVQ